MRGEDAIAAMVLMAAVVLPLPQGAIIKLKALGTKQDVLRASYRNKPFLMYEIFLRYWIWMMGLSLIHYLYYTPDFWITQILEAVKKEENGKYWELNCGKR